MTSSAIVQKLWNYCNIVRDDELSYSDYPSAESILSAAEGLRTDSEQLTLRSSLRWPMSGGATVPSDLGDEKLVTGVLAA